MPCAGRGLRRPKCVCFCFGDSEVKLKVWPNEGTPRFCIRIFQNSKCCLGTYPFSDKPRTLDLVVFRAMQVPSLDQESLDF